jgi:hypothetical protein
MNLIETTLSLANFAKSKPKFGLVIPVWSSPRGHECGSKISFIYYRTETEDGIINFSHIDAGTVSRFDFGRFCSEDTLVLGNRYVRTNGLDYEWVYFEEYGKPFVFAEFVESVYRGYRSNFNELNDCIPLMKWYETLRTIPDIKTRKDWYRHYSDSITELGRLEGAGVKVEVEKFIDRFGLDAQYIHSGIVYTKYNPYTVTGRPSNRHLNVNYSALNKGDGSRESMVSRFGGGTLIGFDFESYHIRIIGKLVGYGFPEGLTAHEHLASYYGVDAEAAKAITFTYLYGGITDEVKDIPFFQKVAAWLDRMWARFVVSGNLTTPLYKRQIHFSRIESPTKQKVFNYLLQALETEINYKKIGELNRLMREMKSKPILYTYDAFLIDTEPTERERVLSEVKGLLEVGGFPVRMYEGNNYNNLEVLSF